MYMYADTFMGINGTQGIVLMLTTECFVFYVLHQRSVRESCERIGSFLHEVCKAEEETGRYSNVICMIEGIIHTFETNHLVTLYQCM